MIQINLLPHREERRKQRRTEFYVMTALAVMSAVVIVFVIFAYYQSAIDSQVQRNNLIKAENAKLDDQIKEIADLRSELDSLKARQQAVEDLQSDRNLPVHLFDEMVKQVPEGIYLISIKQIGMKVTLVGIAQSNDRVSEFLRNMSNNSAWLDSPDLVEIKSTIVGADKRRAFQFTINVNTKRAVASKDGDAAGKPAGAAPAASGAPAAVAPAPAPTAPAAKK